MTNRMKGYERDVLTETYMCGGNMILIFHMLYIVIHVLRNLITNDGDFIGIF